MPRSDDAARVSPEGSQVVGELVRVVRAPDAAAVLPSVVRKEKSRTERLSAPVAAQMLHDLAATLTPLNDWLTRQHPS